MENQKKKLRLEDIKVESFVTDSFHDPATIKGGSAYSDCGCTRSATPCLCSNGCPPPTPPIDPPDATEYNTGCNCS
jgi:hypothetical protein